MFVVLCFLFFRVGGFSAFIAFSWGFVAFVAFHFASSAFTVPLFLHPLHC